MTALLAIDTESGRVRRYEPRRVGGRPICTDEVQIIQPQCHTLAEQLESLRAGKHLEYANLPQDHIPEGAA